MLFFRKLKYIKVLSLVVLGTAFVSCKSNYAFLSIENIQRTPEELPQDIQSVTLVNRSMSKQYQKFNEDSLQMYFYRKGFQLSTIVLDSTASDTTLQALAGLMFESGRYDVVVPVDRNLGRNDSYELLPEALNNERVSQLCSDFKTDALLVLERFSTKVMADFSEEAYFNTYEKSYNATLDLKYDAFFRLYKPGQTVPVKEFAITDTIYWESSDRTIKQVFSKLPSVKQALVNGGIKAALDMDSKISPTWIPEKRGYFLFKLQNDPGQEYVTENEMDKAEQYWQEMAKSQKKKIKSKAEYNLALISELNGDIDKAIEYGLKSFYTYYRLQTQNYLKKLQARKIALQKRP